MIEGAARVKWKNYEMVVRAVVMYSLEMEKNKEEFFSMK